MFVKPTIIKQFEKNNHNWLGSAKLLLLLGYTLLGPLLGGLWLIMEAPLLSEPNLNILELSLLTSIGALLVGLALIPSVIFAGYLGFISGEPFVSSALVTCAILIATFIGIALFRHISGSLTNSLFALKPEWLKEFKRLQRQKQKGMLAMIVVSRLSPHMPFAATNLMIAQLELPLIRATLASWIGLLPRSVFAVFLGAKVTEINQLSNIGTLGWDSMATLALVAILGYWLVKKWVIPKLNERTSK